jgi:hypothetical protein
MAQNEGYKHWKSIVTLVVFIITSTPTFSWQARWQAAEDRSLDLVVVFPFSLTFPQFLVRPIRAFLVLAHILPRPIDMTKVPKITFPFNFVTAPFVSVLFLLALGAIGREEVKNGIIGDDGYVRNRSWALDSSFFLQNHPDRHHGVFPYLGWFHTCPASVYSCASRPTWQYPSTLQVSVELWVSGPCASTESSVIVFTSFSIPSFSAWEPSSAMFGSFLLLNSNLSFLHFQDPIILTSTVSLAYITRAASNILNPRAWIHAQFAVANISSAILVSSNPTNLVLAGAFNIKFTVYTVNMVNAFLVELTQYS